MPASLTSDERRRLNFGTALAEALHVRQRTQSELGEMLGFFRQSSVSGWVSGATLPPDVETVFRIEKVLKLDPGSLSKHLGFLPLIASVPAAVMADRKLDEKGRRAMIDTYEQLAATKRRHPTAHKVKAVKARRNVA